MPIRRQICFHRDKIEFPGYESGLFYTTISTNLRPNAKIDEMETVKLKAQIAEGKIRLEFPCALPAGPAEVVVVVQPLQEEPSPPFDTLHGIWAGLMPEDPG